MSKVTNTVKIVSAYFGAEVLNEKTGIKTRIVNFILDDKISRVRKVEAEKNVIQTKQYGISKGEFDALLIQDELLAHLQFPFTINSNNQVVKTIGSNLTEDDIKSLNDSLQTVEGKTDVLNTQYAEHFDKLRGATITIIREEITKDLVDEDGQPLKDEEGNPKTVVIGYGESEIKSLTLTSVARKLIEKKIFG